MSVRVLDLSGQWRLGWQDVRRGDQMFADLPVDDLVDWIPAAVPGEVHRDLESAGIIAPIEPGLGAPAARWVEDTAWIYRRDIQLDEIPPHAELVFERLELGATVRVNGEIVATHCSAFLPLRVDVSAHLRPGSNRIRVDLDAGQQATTELPAIGYRRSVMQGPDKRNWLRTGQSQFGWDWSPQLRTVGITGPARLELRESPARLVDVVPVVTIADDHSAATVEVRVHLEGESEVRARIGDVSATARGSGRVDLVLEIPEPQLWWPRGMGGQPLYDLEVEAAGETRVLRIGLRELVVDQSPWERGTLFRILANGVPFFAKGGNWVPLSLTPNPVPLDLLDAQLARAVEAGFSFLRVWGGGDYESDAFYDRCDERGIVVWQDLIFACARYPLQVDWFRELVTAEVRHQVRRLARHPSLAIWAADNENAWIGQDATWPGPLVPAQDGATVADYRADHAWFEREAIELVADEDPSRLFWPSSPWSPTDPDHNAGHEGDQHPWRVGFGEVDFLLYREEEATFADEGGLLGPSSLSSVLESLPPEQRDYGSFAWKTHDNEVAMKFVDRPMERLLRDWTGRELHDLSLEEYVYWTGLLHGEAMTEYIDNFRRRSEIASAAVFWMFNDCWPTVRSWSIVDYRARRTPAFHPVRRAFAPVRVMVLPRERGAVVHAHNDTSEDVTLELEAGSTDLGRELRTERMTVTIPPRSVRELRRLDDPAPAYVAILRDGERVVSRARGLSAPYRDLPLGPAEVEVALDGGDAVFRSDAFVLGVALDLNGDLDLGDDFFDLYPGVPHRVRWPHATPPTVRFTGNVAAVPRAADQ